MLLNVLLVYVINIVGIIIVVARVLVPVTSVIAALPAKFQQNIINNIPPPSSCQQQPPTHPLLPGDETWAGDGLHGALGFELSPLLFVKAPIRFGLEPGLGRHCGLR